jgi:hypothetical protein
MALKACDRVSGKKMEYEDKELKGLYSPSTNSSIS